MIKQERTEINGIEYTINTIVATRALSLQPQLMKLIGRSLVAFFEGNDGSAKTPDAIAKLEGEVMKKIVDTLEYFRKRVLEYKKIGIAYVSTAKPLTDEQKKAVAGKLLETTGYVDFQMNYTVDESLIGGMVISIGDRVVDSSIKHKIDELSRRLMQIQL